MDAVAADAAAPASRDSEGSAPPADAAGPPDSRAPDLGPADAAPAAADLANPRDGAPPSPDAAPDTGTVDVHLPTPDAEAPPPDGDGDGVPDAIDLCPAELDPAQRDADRDGLGDACDAGDADADGLPDRGDPCPASAEPTGDRDTDGIGDACDVCPDFIDPAQTDTDGDGRGDPCEVPGDDDADEIADESDDCPHVPDPAQSDRDGDGVGDACDVCPAEPDPVQSDLDADGLGDACDVCPQVPRREADHLDADGDAVPACAGDCDDADPRRTPGRAERCDGLDDDCDGAVDEVYPDLGAACRGGVGGCEVAGVISCTPEGLSGCDAVAGAPQPERCDQIDNDCNGRVDDLEGCCRAGDSRPCGVDLGRCRAGAETCSPEGAWGACSGVAPSPELCNGEDDDCDGQTDEDLGHQVCGQGVCEHPVASCEAAGEVCDPLAGSGPEICNGLDDDCDGQTDEALGTFWCGDGVCRHEAPTCRDGRPGVCSPSGFVPPEVCDRLDNDCNGGVDDPHGTPTQSAMLFRGTADERARIVANGPRLLVGWEDDDAGSFLTAVVDARGQVLAAPRRSNRGAAGMTRLLLGGPEGSFAALSTGNDDQGRQGVLLRPISADGLPAAPLLVSPQNPGPLLGSGGAAGDVGWLVLWSTQADRQVHGRTVLPDGTLGAVIDWGPAFDASGHFSVAWTGQGWAVAYAGRVNNVNAVSLVFLDRDARPLGPSAVVSDVPGNASAPTLVRAGDGFGLVWDEYQGRSNTRVARLTPEGARTGPATSPYAGSSASTLFRLGDGFALAGWLPSDRARVIQPLDADVRPLGGPEQIGGELPPPQDIASTGDVLVRVWVQTFFAGRTEVWLAVGQAACPN